MKSGKKTQKEHHLLAHPSAGRGRGGGGGGGMVCEIRLSKQKNFTQ